MDSSPSNLAQCNGGPIDEVINCCKTSQPCQVNQGDCNKDEECAGDLVCGNLNCGDAFEGFGASCCMYPGLHFL